MDEIQLNGIPQIWYTYSAISDDINRILRPEIAFESRQLLNTELTDRIIEQLTQIYEQIEQRRHLLTTLKENWTTIPGKSTHQRHHDKISSFNARQTVVRHLLFALERIHDQPEWLDRPGVLIPLCCYPSIVLRIKVNTATTPPEGQNLHNQRAPNYY